MKRLSLIPCLIGCCYVFDAEAQTDSLKTRLDSTKVYTTAHVEGEPPKIDGIGNDPAWEQVQWGGNDFRQLQPDAGAAPSAQTVFKILYDAKNLYVLARCFDPDPSKIVRRMSRRDGFDGDFIEINIDSYYDKRTAFSFTASVSGVKGDEYVSNNGSDWDENWDPIWYLDTSIDSLGWVAEFRIPLSQLRFADKPEHVWGIQFTRHFFRNQERSNWQFIPPTANGWVYMFGELHGIKGIRPQKQLEIQPYVVAKTERFEPEKGNPFMTGKSSDVAVGLDAKIGITSDITLDLTVNPDFGQVEADPSQVNLSAFELFFQERRPFFIEGNNTLNFPTSQNSDNNLFYSRRIGRSPQGYVDTDRSGSDAVNEYVRSDARTTILGAAKLTGKNKHGFSWGILESVAGKEKAEVDSLEVRHKETIEPLTNYFVARAQQDINKGNTLVGGMFTATNRKIDSKNLEWLHTEAYSGGLDVTHNWKDRTYYVSAKALMSYVKGSREAILTTQTSSERYFQRPDNYHADVDSAKTSLTGTGGNLMFGKRNGDFVFDLGFNWSSPQLELNDIGFLAQTDKMTQWTWFGYRKFRVIRNMRAQRYNFNQRLVWDFDGKILGQQYNFNAHTQYKNFWAVGGGGTYVVKEASNADLRGGPQMVYPGQTNYFLYVESDSRKKLSFELYSEWVEGFKQYTRNAGAELSLIYRPANALNISLSPSLWSNFTQLQYVETTSNAAGNPRYIMGALDQIVTRISARLTYMVTPNLSIQYYGQLFGTSGEYKNFKYVTDSQAPEYEDRFTIISPTLAGDSYSVDEDGNGTTDYSFSKPDFKFGQYRSNMVIRWEYIPGSTLFLVWNQQADGAFDSQAGSIKSRVNFNFPQQAHSIFLIKYTYRFIL
ncbi:MAG TPA: DUF5916 domain-containing protein [Cyclobacteriaceae bacterium]|nr:DUF5916 domain-containing protein [Cyclobacteriaceae bacterium]